MLNSLDELMSLIRIEAGPRLISAENRQAQAGRSKAERWLAYIAGLDFSADLLISFQVNYPNSDDKTTAHQSFMDYCGYELTHEECSSGSTIEFASSVRKASRQVIPVPDLDPIDTVHYPAFVCYFAKRS